MIKEQLNVGFYKNFKSDNTVRYEVNTLKDLNNVIIPFFIKNPLRGEKFISFLKFKFIVEIMYLKQHYNKDIL